MTYDIDIFCKSYKKDFWLLYFALASFKRNVTGYKNLVLLIPEKDKDDFDTRNLPDRTLVHYVEDKEPGWLYQQVCKMQAYKYCFSEYIMFTDSDCIWDHTVNVQDCVVDGRPEILFTDYKKVGDAVCWQKPTSEFIGEEQEFEFMRRLPLVYHRNTLVAISEYAPELEETIMKSKHFSEFNCLGAYAYKYERDKYDFKNTDGWSYVPPHNSQVWSHASKGKGATEIHLREYVRILETLLKAFSIVVP